MFLTVPMSVAPNNKPEAVILLVVDICPDETIFLTKLISPDVKDKLLHVKDEPDVIENVLFVTKPDELI